MQAITRYIFSQLLAAALFVYYKLVMDSELVVPRAPRRARRGLPLAQAAS